MRPGRVNTLVNSARIEADLGYEYILTLCSAIETATEDTERQQQGAYSYRGRTLRFALERQLYVELIDNDDLYRLFREARLGRSLGRIHLRSQIDRDVARMLCGPQGADRIKPLLPSLRDRIVGKLRAIAHDSLAFRWREPALDPPRLPEDSPDQDAPVCFLLHHSKFVRFARPVLDLLARADVAVLSRDPDLQEQVEALGVSFVPLADGGAPADLVGNGLAEHLNLPLQLDLFAAELKRLHARCLVVIEGNHPLDEVANQACKLLGIPCVCLQQGWSPFLHNGFRNMSFSSMLVWGEGFAELLAPNNPDQRFIVTGSPALEAAGNETGTLAARLAGRKAIAFFHQPASRLVRPEHLRQMADLIRETAAVLPDAEVLVRHHPSEQGEFEGIDEVANVTLVPAGSYGLHEVLACSTAAVSMYSTTLLEAAALLVVPVTFNVTSLPRLVPDLASAAVGVEASDRSAALTALLALVSDETYRESLESGLRMVRERFFAGADGRAAARIAAHIANVARLSGDRPAPRRMRRLRTRASWVSP